jgi:short-subunit dehydrogenase
MFKDQVVVITGASRGLGKSLAALFIKKGAKVILSGRDVAELNKVAEEIGGIVIVADVTKEKEVIELAEQVLEKFGRIDIWINNAGIWLPRASAENIDIKRAHDLIEVNLFGLMYGSRAAIRQMKKQSSGIIVNIISTSALSGRPNQSAYSASKHAAKGFTDSLREEITEKAIKVIGVYPGGMKTDLFNEQKPDEFDQFLSPEDVAEKIIGKFRKRNSRRRANY